MSTERSCIILVRIKMVAFFLFIFFLKSLHCSTLDTVARVIAKTYVLSEHQIFENSNNIYLEMSLKDHFDQQFLFHHVNLINKHYDDESKISSFFSFHFPKMISDSKVVIYPFGGSDFLFPDRFFTQMRKLICIGQEKIGSIPRLEDLNENYAKEIAKTHQKVLDNLLNKSYLITAQMKEHYQQTGALLTLALNIILAGYEIVDCKRFYLENGEEGVLISYKNLETKDLNELIYINADLLSSDLASLYSFLNKFQIDAAFFKATSYLTQKRESLEFNKFILEKVNFILQTDTAIPWSFFDLDEWKIKLFGSYVRPFLDWRSLGAFWGYQEDLHLIYEGFCNRHLNYPVNHKNISWEGFAPFHLDYGGVMTSYKVNPFTTTLMYFEKIGSKI